MTGSAFSMLLKQILIIHIEVLRKVFPQIPNRPSGFIGDYLYKRPSEEVEKN